MLTEPKRLKPGPKPNSKLRHRMAALYFCSVANEEGWTLERISKLCEALYGVGVTPDQIARWAEVHKKHAEKISEQFRTMNDLGV